MSYHIKELEILSVVGKDIIRLAYPTDDSKSAVNILCGSNAAGKSLILEQIAKILKGRSRAQIKTPIVSFSPRPNGQIPMLFIGKAWKAKELVGEANFIHSPEHASSIPIEEGEYRNIARNFFAKQIVFHFPHLSTSNFNEYPLDKNIINLLSTRFGKGDKIYLCSRKDPLIRQLEKVLNGTLYFRCKENNTRKTKLTFHLVLAFQDGTTVPYDRWSDGQRAFFYLTAALNCIKPEIVLYDEPENHMHPGLLTSALEQLKSSPGQYLIATHHPHLIFSHYVDRVNYIETYPPPNFYHPPKEYLFSTNFLQQPRKHQIHVLEDSFDQLISAYRLFQHNDNQLLRQAAYIEKHATLSVLYEINELFSSKIATAKPSALPDTQTQQLRDSIRRIANPMKLEKIKIADLGAGIGRQITEMDKLTMWQTSTNVEWLCFEPDQKNRETMTQKIGKRKDVQIASEYSEIPGQQFNLCLIANVLHELTPAQIAKMLLEATRIIIPKIGYILILEIYPLIRPEGFAVPYDFTTLNDILLKIGLICDVSPIQLVPTGSTAYCIFARPNSTDSIKSYDEILQTIQSSWDETLERSLASYCLGNCITDVEQHVNLLSKLTTIASICAWKKGFWKAE